MSFLFCFTSNKYDSNKLQYYTIFVTSVSLITTLILTLASTTIAIMSKSSSTAAFAANSSLDLLNCCIVFWRYYDTSSNYLLNEHEQAKEKKTCFYLGLMFIISALAVIGKAIYDLLEHSITTNFYLDKWINFLSSIGIVLCLMLTILKFWLYEIMHCDSIYHDAISSLINLLFAILIIFTSLMMKNDLKFWYLDPLGSFLISIFMIIYGFYVIISTSFYKQEKKPWIYNSIV